MQERRCINRYIYALFVCSRSHSIHLLASLALFLFVQSSTLPSESVVGGPRLASVDHHLDLGPGAEVLRLHPLCIDALRLGKQMEVHVCLLSLVLVNMQASLVVMS